MNISITRRLVCAAIFCTIVVTGCADFRPVKHPASNKDTRLAKEGPYADSRPVKHPASNEDTRHAKEGQYYVAPRWMPNWFSSEKELREGIVWEEWLVYTVQGQRFILVRIPYPSIGSSKERFICWLCDKSDGHVSSVWDVWLMEQGATRIDYDERTTRLSITAIGNTRLKGKAVAGVYLSALGTWGQGS